MTHFHVSWNSPKPLNRPRYLHAAPESFRCEDANGEDSEISEIEIKEKEPSDKRIKYKWISVEDEKLKKEYLTKSQVDFRHQHAIRGSLYGNVLKCVLHTNCDFKLRILWHGRSFRLSIKILFRIISCIAEGRGRLVRNLHQRKS
jgi:hypothetical protein